MNRIDNVLLSGVYLINKFQTTQILIKTMDIAQYQAELSENNILSTFSSFKNTQNAIVGVNDLPLNQDNILVKNSLDAHLKKVQSEQIKSQGHYNIQEFKEHVKLYINKRVSIKVIDGNAKPIHNRWFNKNTGHEHFGLNKSKNVSGTIVYIDLINNYLIIKPSTFRRIINSSLVNYVVEVISINNNQPLISIEIN